MSLEGYLEEQFNSDLQDINAIEQTLVRVARTFSITFDKEACCWPYQVKISSSASMPPGSPSQGTTAMILSAIGKMLGKSVLRDGNFSEKLSSLPPNLSEFFDEATTRLYSQIEKAGKITSATFGENDPITISHVTAFASGVRSLSKPKISSVISSAKNKIDDFLKISPSDDSEFQTKLGEGWCTRSAFVALRIVRSWMDFDPDQKPSPYKDFFDSRLHEQLSFSSIPDSRFDPAELAFCLEGLLLCAHESVDPVLFERVFSVLGEKQGTSAYWRPNRPFRADSKGQIMLPLSVEGANSLVRAVEIMDGGKLHGTFSGLAVPMFRRFWQWLRARKVETVSNQGEYIGWHSEHINETGLIDLWDTSQVAEFLIAFRKLLKRHIGRETLVRSRVKFNEPKPQQNWKAAWENIVKTFEPLGDTTIGDRIFERIRSDFVEPWKQGNSAKNHSMLLYGPPGTGKTTIASSIADALSFRLITITVSDFLGSGGALVEARAKAIFQMLEAQSDCVILFDEVDAFLLDRDSEHYRQQDTLFQFLTPGMLTKINDLRSAARSIFIIATNYENRIDPAIKRPGRIDRKYLFLPPDASKRCEIIKSKLASLSRKFDEHTINEMANAALYLGYKEIVGALDQNSGALAADALCTALKEAQRSSGHQHYLSRLGKETFPVEEFIAAVKMARQSRRQDWIEKDLKSLDTERANIWKKLIEKNKNLKTALTTAGINM